jgi:hypothetical protein
MKRVVSVPLFSCLWLLGSLSSQAIVDSNDNGLSDLWEKAHNGGSLFPSNFDPQADPDGDGWSNAQEAAAGTDPSDANPPTGYLQPEITCYPAIYHTDPGTSLTETQSPATVTLNWPTLPGKQYTLLYSTDLAPGNWSPLDEPRIGTGWDMGNGITLTQQDGSIADRIFWRVAVSDPVPAIDSDGDGLGDYEEYLANTDPVISDSDGDTLSDYAELIAGTNPNHADEDGDGITDPLELAAGTDPNNQDTDSDAIPDYLDSQPLLSAQVFADADDDGIPDAEDPDPNNPRGSKPLIISENAAGNPQCELEIDDSSNFILTVNNSAGPAPSSSDFKLYLNGTEETATITALTTPPSATGTQRFLLSWTAKVTTGYPAQTLQNISLRFKDAQNATTWLNLARVDVAEWEGMIAGVSGNGLNSDNFPIVNVVSHHRGIQQRPEQITDGNSIWYRGPKAIPLLDASGSNTGATAHIGAERYPLFIISRSGSEYTVEQTFDVSAPVAYPHHGYFYVNRTPAAITMQPSTVGSLSVPAGGTGFQPFPPAPETGTPNIGVLGTSFINGEQSTIYSGVWELLNPRGTARQFSSLEFTSITHANGTAEVLADDSGGVRAAIGATITPHSAGTLEYPGMPIGSSHFPPAPYNHHSSTTPLLPIQSEQWHKLVLKVGPDAGALSNGITLKLGTGEEGENDPQIGFSLQFPGTGGFEPLTIPADGKIEMLPSSELYQKLTSPEGLTLFLKRDSTVSEFHRLGLDLIPKRSTYLIQRVAALDLLPVEVEQEGHTSEEGIRFCRWLDSFNGNSLKPDCADNDRDRFRIRIPAVLPNLTKIHIRSFGLATAVINGLWESKYTDGDYDVTMTEENGAMVSKWMLLVSDGDDDVEYNGIGTENGTNDQTLLANFNSPIEVTLPEYQNAKVTFHAQKPLGDLEIQPYYLSPAGDVPPVMADLITNHLEKMKEIYRQIGVRVGNYGIVGKAVPQSWFDAGTVYPANHFTKSETEDAWSAVYQIAIPENRIRVGFVDATLMAGDGFGIPVRGLCPPGGPAIVSLDRDRTDARWFLGVTAHEMGHALGLEHLEQLEPVQYNLVPSRWLMRAGDELSIWENSKLDSKRFQSGDFDIIRNSNFFDAPN